VKKGEIAIETAVNYSLNPRELQRAL